MTIEEQKAIYDAIHKVELAVLKDNQAKHEDTLERIHKLAETVKEHNGIKSKVTENLKDIKECKSKMDEHITYHKAEQKQKGTAFYKFTTIVALLIAATAAVIAAIK